MKRARPPASHEELLLLLRALREQFGIGGQGEVCVQLDRAIGNASTVPATEFYGESLLALRLAVKRRRGVLAAQEAASAKAALRALERLFRRRKPRTHPPA